MIRNQFDSAVSAIFVNSYILSKVQVLLPDTPRAKSHVETWVYVVDPNQYGKFVHYISSRYDFYTIENCGQFLSHSPKYVGKDFIKL